MRNDKEEFVASVLNRMRAHFGNAVKAYWFYEDDLCPCCMTHPIGEVIYQGKQAMSLNAFMYRERGVMISYLLCGQCAERVMAEGNDKNPDKPLHQAIEQNLVTAYKRHLNSQNA